MYFLYFLILGVLIAVEYIMSKKIILANEKKMSDTAVYNWYFVGLIVFAIPIVVTIWVLGVSQPHPLYPFFITLLFCFRAFMEFKYIRDTKRHLVSISVAATSLLITVLFLLLRFM